MAYRTPYGKHYHEEYGCHGATIPCDTKGLTPCSDCCGGKAGSDEGPGVGAGGGGAVAGGNSGGTYSMSHDQSVSEHVPTLADYEGLYDPTVPVSRVVDMQNATLIEHTDGSMEAVCSSSCADVVKFFPSDGSGRPDTILVQFTPRYAARMGLKTPIYMYTGTGVTREVYEGIVSDRSVGRAVNHRLIWGGDAVTASFVTDDENAPVDAVLRGGVSARRGMGALQGADSPDVDVTVASVIGHERDAEGIPMDVPSALHGGSLPQPVIVTMRRPENAEVRAKLDEFDLDVTADRAGFSKGLEESRHMNPYGCYVDGKSPENLEGARMFISPDRRTGCSVLADGDIVGVFNSNPDKHGAVRPLLELAKQNGGTKMDCYDADGSGLVRMYQTCGFEPVARVPFNGDYVEDNEFNAPLLRAQPDVYVLKLREDPTDTHVMSAEELAALPVFDQPETGYDEAWEYRDRLLAEQQARQAAAAKA